MKIPRLIISDSEHDSNMFYATKSLVPDDFIYLEINGKKIIFMDDMEFGRVNKEAEVGQAISCSKYNSAADRDTVGNILIKILSAYAVIRAQAISLCLLTVRNDKK